MSSSIWFPEVEINDTRLRQDLSRETLGDEGSRRVGHSGETVYDSLVAKGLSLAPYLLLTPTVTAAFQLVALSLKGKTLLIEDDETRAYDINLTDTIELPSPCNVIGMGKGLTTVTFTNMGGFTGLDGFRYIEGMGRLKGSKFHGITVQIEGQDGRRAIAMPRGNTVFNLNRPTYEITDVVFKGTVMSGDTDKQDLYDYTWQDCIYMGDGVGHVIENVEAYGKYNWTLDPAGQNVTASFMNLSTVQNVGGMLQPRIKNVVSIHVPIGLHIGYRVSQLVMTDFQFHRSWIGINCPHASVGSDYSTLESMFARGNINSQRKGIYMEASAFIAYSNVRSTRASGGFDHALGWEGWDLNDITQLVIDGQGRGTNLGAYVNSTHIGMRLNNPDLARVYNLAAESCADGFVLINPTRTRMVNCSTSSCTNGFSVSGTAQQSAILYPDFISTTTPLNYIGGVNRGGCRAYLISQSVFAGVDTSNTTFNTAGTTTITPRVDNELKRLQALAGTYTRVIQVLPTNAITGDRVTIHLTISGSLVGAVEIRDGASTLLATLTSANAITSIDLVFNGSQFRISRANATLA